MGYDLNFVELVSSSFWIVFGFLVALAVGKYFKTNSFRILLLYFWHLILCMVYLNYLSTYEGDAIAYYQNAANGSVVFGLGTDAIVYILTPLVYGLGFSMLSCFLIFNIFGVVGLLAFDASLRLAVQNSSKFWQYVSVVTVFLPSVSFWSAAIGKDSLSFMATGLALWAAINLSNRWKLMGLSVMIMLLVRPHIAAIMIMALALSVPFGRKNDLSKRLINGIFFGIVALMATVFGLDYVGLGDFSFSKLIEFIEIRRAYNLRGGGAVDIQNISLPMQLIGFMLRPSILEVDSIYSIAAAIDNLVLTFIFGAGVFYLKNFKKTNLDQGVIFMVAYSFIVWIVLGATISNLGIAVRQKWMFAPMLVYLIMSLTKLNTRIPAGRI